MAYARTIAISLLALLACDTAFAGGSMFSANGVGEHLVGGGIRTLGLGGGGFGYQDSMGFNSLNPALSAFAPRTAMRMAGEIGFWNTTENGLTDTDGEMTWRDVQLYIPLTKRWKLGAGIEPTRRQDLHTIGLRSAAFPDTTSKLYEERSTWTGSTVDVRFDNAYKFSERFSLGLGVIYSFQYNQRSTIIDFGDATYQDVRYTTTNTFRGWSASLGAYYKASDRLGVGGFFRPRSKGNHVNEYSKSGTDSTIESDDRADSPGEFGAGLSYKLSSSFVGVADLYMSQWSDQDYGFQGTSVANGHVQDPIFASVGFERLSRRAPLYSGLDLWSYRAGLFYRKHYWITASGDPVTDIGLSAGTSIPIAKSSGWLHWTAEVGKRRMDEKKIGATETFFRLSFQVEIAETWFQRTRPRVPQ